MRISICGFSLQIISVLPYKNNINIIFGRVFYKDFKNKASSYMAIANFQGKIQNEIIDDIELFGRDKLLIQYEKEVNNIINRLTLNTKNTWYFIVNHIYNFEKIIKNIHNNNKEIKSLLFKIQNNKEKIITDELLNIWINIDPYFYLSLYNNSLYYYGYFFNPSTKEVLIDELKKDVQLLIDQKLINNKFILPEIDIKNINQLNIKGKELCNLYLNDIKDSFTYNFDLFKLAKI